MNNFGEEMAYWYLRLNGFFVLRNYVQHEVADHGEMDMIAIRLPDTREKVRDLPITWDAEEFGRVGIDLSRDTIGLLAEVKSGRVVEQPQMNEDREARLRGAIERTGIFGYEDAERALRALKDGFITGARPDHCVIVKMFFHDAWPEHQRWNGWHPLDLRAADRFIRSRFREYVRKQGGWPKFPSDVIQYIMWQLRHDENAADQRGQIN
jgi:hypothetical protein